MIELISQANKERPERRSEFITKCAALLQQEITVCLVDLVTVRHFNLYHELLDHIGQSDPAISDNPPATYAATCSWQPHGSRRLLRAWNYELTPGESLPVLPIPPAEDFGVTLDLEATYEETGHDLRIA